MVFCYQLPGRAATALHEHGLRYPREAEARSAQRSAAPAESYTAGSMISIATAQLESIYIYIYI